MGKLNDTFKIILGLLVLLVGIYLIVIWSGDVWFLIKILFKGLIGITVGLIGLIILILGISNLRQ